MVGSGRGREKGGAEGGEGEESGGRGGEGCRGGGGGRRKRCEWVKV